VTFTVLTVLARRLDGMWVLVASPFLARDASEWLAGFAWPAWLRPAGARAAAVAIAAVLVSVPEWLRPDVAIGVGVDPATTPAAACDFIEAHGIRGRAFNHFEFGSMMLFRFWPDRERLPFMDIHQAGTPESRALYLSALGSAEAWGALDQRYGFDFALLRRLRARGDVLADVLDADSTWALVFTDDAAALYVRRAGRFRALADSCGYGLVAGGPAKLDRSWAEAMADSTTRRGFARELERMAAESAVNSTAHSLLAYVADFEGRRADARRELARAHDVDPGLPRYHDRLGLSLMSEGRLAEAREEFGIAARRRESPYPDFEIGLAWLREGNLAEARRALARSVATHPEIAAAADSLRALDARGR
jgi:tetratricopeptide (TPR) repeat protein